MPSILVTGANRGLGLEFVKQYAASGYRVFATARKLSDASKLRALAEQYESVSLHELELTDDAAVRALAQQLAAEPIDILLSNAGTMGPKQQTFGRLDFQGMLETFNTNTIAPLRLAEVFVEHVAKSERKLMVAVTSGMGSIDDSSGGSYAYRASKAALNMSYHNIALDLKSRRIISIVINPGWVKTDMGGAGAKLEPSASIGAMRQVFDSVSLADSGKFMNYTGGTLTW